MSERVFAPYKKNALKVSTCKPTVGGLDDSISLDGKDTNWSLSIMSGMSRRSFPIAAHLKFLSWSSSRRSKRLDFREFFFFSRDLGRDAKGDHDLCTCLVLGQTSEPSPEWNDAQKVAPPVRVKVDLV
ncbi:hypothetical protein CDAR_573781 [Caerostris darwini]|uniref:Uncharacterized protein n=1 Tax=Caerostris darwini TaxID=1538125 RepID=A0AAV4MCL9_9ARAC|nr:hypothetical protein CDAR_573781 [Caerostris darwini]